MSERGVSEHVFNTVATRTGEHGRFRAGVTRPG